MKNATTFSAKQNSRIEIDKRNAYHQAGHVVAIYLGKRQRQLPMIYFQIIKQQEHNGQLTDQLKQRQGKCTVTVEDGSLIQSLLVSFPEATQHHRSQEGYRCAFEVDIINVLAGSLAEAKYVALCDGEVFNANVIHLGALHSYGGSSDLESITEYMRHFIPCEMERNQKLAELFRSAYSFVNKKISWLAISTLAEFIMAESHSVIDSDKVISLLESRLAA